MSDDVTTHASAWRVATVYDVPLPPRDPSGTDATTSWAMVVTLLLLMPPLGWLQLRHRSDVDGRVRLAVALVAALLVGAAWATALRVQPWV